MQGRERERWTAGMRERGRGGQERGREGEKVKERWKRGVGRAVIDKALG